MNQCARDTIYIKSLPQFAQSMFENRLDLKKIIGIEKGQVS